VAVIPFESILGVAEARKVVTGEVAAALAAKGLEVVSGEPVEALLQRERVRYFDSLPRQVVERVAVALGAEAVVAGQVVAFERRQGARDPRVVLTAQVVSRRGETLWSGFLALTGAETEDALGQHRIVDLAPLATVAVRRLFEPLKLPLAATRVGRSAGPFGLPRVFRAKSLDDGPRRIFVLPLADFTGQPGVARTVEAILQERLAQRRDLALAPTGEVRQAVVANGLPAPSQMGSAALVRLADAVGTPYGLGGAVLAWGTETTPKGLAGPEVEIYLELTDLKAGRVVWSGLHRRNGADFEGLLKLGALTNLPAVADRVVSELSEAFLR
jgi:TolB-like protein